MYHSNIHRYEGVEFIGYKFTIGEYISVYILLNNLRCITVNDIFSEKFIFDNIIYDIYSKYYI